MPIGVSQGQTKSAKEVFSVNNKAMRDKDELTKEEKRRERAHRKRQIKAHLHDKAIKQKEKNREKGLALAGDRFAVREVQRSLNQKKKAEKRSKELGHDSLDNSKSKYKSGKFFNAMNAVTKSDKERKDLKRHAKDIGKVEGGVHNNGSTKRYKI